MEKGLVCFLVATCLFPLFREVSQAQEVIERNESTLVIKARKTSDVYENLPIPDLKRITKAQVQALAEQIAAPDSVEVCSYVLADITGDKQKDLVFAFRSRAKGPCSQIEILFDSSGVSYEAVLTGIVLGSLKNLVIDLNNDGRFEVIVPDMLEDNFTSACDPYIWNIYKWNPTKRAMVMANAEFPTFYKSKATELRNLINAKKEDYSRINPCRARELAVIERQLQIWSGQTRTRVNMTDLSTGDESDSIFERQMRVLDLYNQRANSLK